jgi:HSP20 family protein
MANLVRYDPFRELMDMRRNWDRLFDERLFDDNFFAPISQNGHTAPLVDLYQTDQDVHVKAVLPGVKPEDVDIQVSGDTLTIRAETKHEEEKKEATYHLREQRYASYARSILLPAAVQADKAKAEVKDGILHLTLPKAEAAKAKVIKVKAS